MKKRQFIGDGLISAGLGITLPAGMAALCRPGGMICAISQYVFDFLLGPYKYIATDLTGKIASTTRMVHEAGYKSSSPEMGDYFLLGLGILEYLVYWFVAGVIVCGVWRAVRNQVQTLCAHRFGQVDLGGQGK
jgi:hypothetical protein